MNILQIYQDYSIQTASENDKHYRPGWINTACPFCSGNVGNHLGYNIQNNYFFCWRCGSHPIPWTLSKLLGINYSEAKRLVYQYKGKTYEKTQTIKVKKSQFRMPSGLMRIPNNKLAMKYMLKRGFSEANIVELEEYFDLYCTGPVSTFDNMDMSYRLIAPIKINNEIVSWQSRDLTGKSDLKYITCSKKREKIDHKTILYNRRNEKESVILVEGIFDVWKLYLAGFPAVCCFGVGYTYEQLKLLMDYETVMIFFDPDKAGKQRAKEIHRQLIFSGTKSIIIKNDTGKDAGDLTIEEIKEVIK